MCQLDSQSFKQSNYIVNLIGLVRNYRSKRFVNFINLQNRVRNKRYQLTHSFGMSPTFNDFYKNKYNNHVQCGKSYLLFYNLVSNFRDSLKYDFIACVEQRWYPNLQLLTIYTIGIEFSYKPFLESFLSSGMAKSPPILSCIRNLDV